MVIHVIISQDHPTMQAAHLAAFPFDDISKSFGEGREIAHSFSNNKEEENHNSLFVANWWSE